ncbi:hypothetical protein F3B23_14980 [Bacteroides fragilis]|uniref:Uncharacterized protein n=1 Tax=Bacteroides fragilis TaxID=817 RepID=A0A5M5WJN1_BACFG|nr:hypothetical protein F3B28_17775 [Bacteroides fragilis]KAA4706501.1 hypothetical protein F3B27_17830 [Bacteroides fragilis]KAA4715311.1 hypothetical protein F3B32_16790 [Bacteroides fragilis]KAA4728777.1 hypothetical protein F3B30_11050 [Bacteroides fragilis]KAA4729222.1 hypothetical protein F3B23_14980 [Bacteroides fragilis]
MIPHTNCPDFTHKHIIFYFTKLCIFTKSDNFKINEEIFATNKNYLYFCDRFAN